MGRRKTPRKRESTKRKTAKKRRVRTRAAKEKVVELIDRAVRDEDRRLADALNAWKKLRRKDQIALAATVADTRSSELVLAYPDVVSVGHGFRTTNKKGRTLTSEPCVVFMVSRKRKRVAKAKQLPTSLLAYWGTSASGKGTLCAVPVDIESGTDYDVKPHALPRPVCVAKAGAPTQQGVITCAVGLSTDATGVYALSCHHLLAMSTVTSPDGRAATGARVSRCGHAEFGGLSEWTGKLVASTEGPSFDAALAKVDANQVGELVAAMGGTAPKSPPAEFSIPLFATIRTPDGLVSVEYVQTWTSFSKIAYFSSPPQPVQGGIVEWMVTSGSVVGGHSGSPVVSGSGALLGMHIAGTDTGDRAFMQPADMLLFAPNYGVAGTMDMLTV